MLKLSLNLPKYRLHLRLAKRRGPLFEEPIIPDLKEIKNTRSGNKISRFFRHVFEHRDIKKILGANFAFLIIASSLVPTTNVLGQTTTATNEVISFNNTVLNTEREIQLPLDHLAINQGYSFFHPAIDMGANIGDPIRPIKAGVVQDIYNFSFGYGNAILIDHGDGISSLYAHLSKINVKIGDSVDKNTIIGLVGVTGHTTGPHLHLEIRDNGVQVNPLTYLLQ